METTIETIKEPWYKTLFFYPFRVIASLLSALSMDENGFSLKKILAVFSTWEMAKITDKWACKENAIAYLIIWLLWTGLLVSLYSSTDLLKAFSIYKGKKEDK